MSDSQRDPSQLRRLAERTRRVADGVDPEIAALLHRFARSYEGEAAAAERARASGKTDRSIDR